MAAVDVPVDPQPLTRVDLGEFVDAPDGTVHLPPIVEGAPWSYSLRWRTEVRNPDGSTTITYPDISTWVVTAEIATDPVLLGGTKLATFTFAAASPQTGDDLGRGTLSMTAVETAKVFAGVGGTGAYDGTEPDPATPRWDLWVDKGPGDDREWWGLVARTLEQMITKGGA